MLTIFTTPKPFIGHESIIQRNAIKSWTLLHPDIEIILFGDEEGSEQICSEFGINHEPYVMRNEYGTKYLNYIFDKAQQISKHDILCYVNCDIILTNSFIKALQIVTYWNNEFLMVGQRWDINMKKEIDFNNVKWDQDILKIANEKGDKRPPQWIDYFIFSRGLYLNNTLPFVIGRPGWDNWLIWKACKSKVPVVDITSFYKAIHQNHDYNYHKDGYQGVWHGEEAKRNYKLIGGWKNFYTIRNSTHKLIGDEIKINDNRRIYEFKHSFLHYYHFIFMNLLRITRPVRHFIGIRRS